MVRTILSTPVHQSGAPHQNASQPGRLQGEGYQQLGRQQGARNGHTRGLEGAEGLEKRRAALQRAARQQGVEVLFMPPGCQGTRPTSPLPAEGALRDATSHESQVTSRESQMTLYSTALMAGRRSVAIGYL